MCPTNRDRSSRENSLSDPLPKAEPTGNLRAITNVLGSLSTRARITDPTSAAAERTLAVIRRLRPALATPWIRIGILAALATFVFVVLAATQAHAAPNDSPPPTGSTASRSPGPNANSASRSATNHGSDAGANSANPQAPGQNRSSSGAPESAKGQPPTTTPTPTLPPAAETPAAKTQAQVDKTAAQETKKTEQGAAQIVKKEAQAANQAVKTATPQSGTQKNQDNQGNPSGNQGNKGNQGGQPPAATNPGDDQTETPLPSGKGPNEHANPNSAAPNGLAKGAGKGNGSGGGKSCTATDLAAAALSGTGAGTDCGPSAALSTEPTAPNPARLHPAQPQVAPFAVSIHRLRTTHPATAASLALSGKAAAGHGRPGSESAGDDQPGWDRTETGPEAQPAPPTPTHSADGGVAVLGFLREAGMPHPEFEPDRFATVRAEDSQAADRPGSSPD